MMCLLLIDESGGRRPPSKHSAEQPAGG